ncbi:dethiobiotin synthase [Micrococcales bacterium 31B]|nr:dethiobiotin synthase [Micrococcales bacterium 31B]
MTAQITFITGTDTEVGKTVTTAALASLHAATGQRVVIYKPAQTGVPPYGPDDAVDPDPANPTHGDAAWAARRAGCDAAPDGVRLAEPLAPVMAARRAGVELPSLAEHERTVHDLATRYDHVLIEGAGGVLVGLAPGDTTLAHLAARFADPALVVVARPALGTLNHTCLTTRELERAVPHARRRGLVIGTWPGEFATEWEHEVATENRAELERLSGWPVLGALPAGLGVVSPAALREIAGACLDLAPLGGLGIIATDTTPDAPVAR